MEAHIPGRASLPSHPQVDWMLTNRHGEAKKVKLGVQVTQLFSFWPSKQ